MSKEHYCCKICTLQLKAVLTRFLLKTTTYINYPHFYKKILSPLPCMIFSKSQPPVNKEGSPYGLGIVLEVIKNINIYVKLTNWFVHVDDADEVFQAWDIFLFDSNFWNCKALVWNPISITFKLILPLNSEDVSLMCICIFQSWIT